jgi:ketoreductase RED2
MSTTQEFAGKVALITGSSSGIGEETARRLSALGATVVVNSSQSVEAGEAVAAALPGTAVYIRADISSQDEAHGLIDATIERFGQLDFLINNAGWTTEVPHHQLDDLTDEIFRKTFDVNVFGTWWLTKRAIPHLRKSDDPNIVNITSIAGVRPVGSSMAYSMTKAALNQMTLLLAKSYGPIRVNAVDQRLGCDAYRCRRHRSNTAFGDTRRLRRGGARVTPQQVRVGRDLRRRRRPDSEDVRRAQRVPISANHAGSRVGRPPLVVQPCTVTPVA